MLDFALQPEFSVAQLLRKIDRITVAPLPKLLAESRKSLELQNAVEYIWLSDRISRLTRMLGEQESD